MEKEELKIIVGGKAGQGVDAISNVLAKAFVKLGYYAFNYRDYQSLIRGGHNYNGIRVSINPVYSHAEENLDFLICLDDRTYKIHKNKLKEDSIVILDEKIKNIIDKDLNVVSVNVDEVLKQANAPKISENVVLASLLWKVLNLDKEVLKEILKKEFKKDFNLKIVDIVFNNYNFEIKVNLKKPEKKELYYINGSEAVAYGAILGGIDLYIAYPMTPASPVLHILAKLQKEFDIRVYQPENEIAVINMALGASYAGAKVMVGTSGGGFALMNEGISLQGMSEIPVVIYLAQRYAPATGIPTYTSQGDLKFALNAGHGEFPRVVIAPGNHKEAIRRTTEAFYLAYKYNVLAIVLSDKHLAESSATYDSLGEIKQYTERFLELNPKEDYKFYKITETGVSPRTIPGLKNNIVVKANSYEHDEYGITTEEGEWAIKMSKKRMRKIEYIKEEIRKLEPFKLYNEDGKYLLISWGSPTMAVLDFIRENEDFAFLQISYISPFLEKEIKEILERYDEKILIENNVTGLLGQVIRENTGIKIEKKILKYDARPFTKEYLEREIKRAI